MHRISVWQEECWNVAREVGITGHKRNTDSPTNGKHTKAGRGSETGGG